MKLFQKKHRRKNSHFKNLMFLHWTMIPFFLLLYLTGVFVARLSNENNLAYLFPFLHQSFGISIIILLTARTLLLLRLTLHNYSKRASKRWFLLRRLALQTALYFLMFLIPISGLLLRNYRGIDTTFFGIYVSSLVSKNYLLAEIFKKMHFLVFLV